MKESGYRAPSLTLWMFGKSGCNDKMSLEEDHTRNGVLVDSSLRCKLIQPSVNLYVSVSSMTVIE